jgi:hypothetical protein
MSEKVKDVAVKELAKEPTMKDIAGSCSYF